MFTLYKKSNSISFAFAHQKLHSQVPYICCCDNIFTTKWDHLNHMKLSHSNYTNAPPPQSTSKSNKIVRPKPKFASKAGHTASSANNKAEMSDPKDMVENVPVMQFEEPHDALEDGLENQSPAQSQQESFSKDISDKLKDDDMTE